MCETGIYPIIRVKRSQLEQLRPVSLPPNGYTVALSFGYTLRERLCTHKVFTKDQCFYLNYHKFSIKSYVLDVY